MKLNWLKIGSFILLLVVAVGGWMLLFHIPNLIVKIDAREMTLRDGSPMVELFERVNQEGRKGKHFEVATDDGLKLQAYLTYSKQKKDKGTVILLHGIRSWKENFAEMSQSLAKQGYNAVALDLRAHGQSEGTYCTFGVNEKQDVKLLIDEIIKEGLNSNIGVWGQSLGGAIALQSLAHDPRLKFGIIESTFSDFSTIVHDYIGYHTGVSIEILSEFLMWRAGKIGGFNPSAAVPAKSCNAITQPVLMVHGDEGQRIAIEYGKINYNELSSSDKEFVTVQGANHLNVWNVGGSRYRNKVSEFLKSL